MLALLLMLAALLNCAACTAAMVYILSRPLPTSNMNQGQNVLEIHMFRLRTLSQLLDLSTLWIAVHVSIDHMTLEITLCVHEEAKTH